MEDMARTGVILAISVWAVFAVYWIRDVRKRRKLPTTAGTWLNAAGFALLPAIAVWKIFEPYTALNTAGKKIAADSAAGILLTGEGRLIPWRIELAAALAAFTAIIVWLMFRKKDMEENGDLALTVLCVWGAVRSVTEGMRENTARIGPVSVIICAAIAAELTALTVWTIRRGKKEKSAGLTALEWATVIAGGAVILLLEGGILFPENTIAEIGISSGCALLAAVLILFAGKDSREV